MRGGRPRSWSRDGHAAVRIGRYVQPTEWTYLLRVLMSERVWVRYCSTNSSGRGRKRLIYSANTVRSQMWPYLRLNST